MGDGLGGAALAIVGAMLCMLVVPAALGAVLGRRFLREHPQASLGAVVGGLLGAGLGMLVVVATFYEDTFSPPAVVVIEVPDDFAHEWAVVLEDPSASTEIVWDGSSLPFTTRTARVAVGRGGVVRVRALGPMTHDIVDARRADGRSANAGYCLLREGGLGPMCVFHFGPLPGDELDFADLDEHQRATRIAILEAEQ